MEKRTKKIVIEVLEDFSVKVDVENMSGPAEAVALLDIAKNVVLNEIQKRSKIVIPNINITSTN